MKMLKEEYDKMLQRKKTMMQKFQEEVQNMNVNDDLGNALMGELEYQECLVLENILCDHEREVVSVMQNCRRQAQVEVIEVDLTQEADEYEADSSSNRGRQAQVEVIEVDLTQEADEYEAESKNKNGLQAHVEIIDLTEEATPSKADSNNNCGQQALLAVIVDLTKDQDKSEADSNNSSGEQAQHQSEKFPQELTGSKADSNNSHVEQAKFDAIKCTGELKGHKSNSSNVEIRSIPGGHAQVDAVKCTGETKGLESASSNKGEKAAVEDEVKRLVKDISNELDKQDVPRKIQPLIESGACDTCISSQQTRKRKIENSDDQLSEKILYFKAINLSGVSKQPGIVSKKFDDESLPVNSNQETRLKTHCRSMRVPANKASNEKNA